MAESRDTDRPRQIPWGNIYHTLQLFLLANIAPNPREKNVQREDGLSGASDIPGCIMFLSRKFPPSTGGMQKFSQNLLRSLKEKDAPIESYTWGGSQLWLPLVLPYLWLRAVMHALWSKTSSRREQVDVVYGTEGLISPLILAIGRLFGLKTVITLHGLDIVFDNILYQKLIVPTFQFHDRIVCVSHATARAAVQAGVPRERITVIPNGVNPDEYYREESERKELVEVLLDKTGGTRDLRERTILLSVGRLVERKGIHWFVSEVVPELGWDHVYIICGSGPKEDEIRELVEENDLEGMVFLLGYVSADLLATVYNVSDALVMPNISVEGDMEGFGLVAVEASSCGTPVLAADIEGMQDSVLDGKTGVRVTEGDADSFVTGVTDALNLNPEEVRTVTEDEFRWSRQSRRYREVFQEVAS